MDIVDRPDGRSGCSGRARQPGRPQRRRHGRHSDAPRGRSLALLRDGRARSDRRGKRARRVDDGPRLEAGGLGRSQRRRQGRCAAAPRRRSLALLPHGRSAPHRPGAEPAGRGGRPGLAFRGPGRPQRRWHGRRAAAPRQDRQLVLLPDPRRTHDRRRAGHDRAHGGCRLAVGRSRRPGRRRQGRRSAAPCAYGEMALRAHGRYQRRRRRAWQHRPAERSRLATRPAGRPQRRRPGRRPAPQRRRRVALFADAARAGAPDGRRGRPAERRRMAPGRHRRSQRRCPRRRSAPSQRWPLAVPGHGRRRADRRRKRPSESHQQCAVAHPGQSASRRHRHRGYVGLHESAPGPDDRLHGHHQLRARGHHLQRQHCCLRGPVHGQLVGDGSG